MAISIADFGSSVEEVQQKLGDLLPLLEEGGEKINNLQTGEQRGNSNEGPLEIFLSLEERSALSSEVADHIQTNGEKIDPELNDVFVKVKERLDKGSKLAEEANETLKSVEETLEDQLVGKFREVADTFETDLKNNQEKFVPLTIQITSMKTSFSNTRGIVVEQLKVGLTQESELHSALIAALEKSQSMGLETITKSSTDQLSRFEDMTSDMQETVTAKLTEIRNELNGMLDALREDRRAVVWGYVEQYQVLLEQIFGMFTETSDKVIEEIESSKNDPLEQLKLVIDVNQALGKKAKTLLEDVVSKLSGVAEAMRTAESINQAM